jgi:hypothetical protein
LPDAPDLQNYRILTALYADGTGMVQENFGDCTCYRLVTTPLTDKGA